MMKNNFVLASGVLVTFFLLSGFAGAVGITDGTFGGVTGVEQGKTYSTNVLLTNSPNRNNYFTVSVGGEVGGWVTSISPSSFNLSAGGTKLVTLTILVPDSAGKGTHTGTVTATGAEIIGGGTVGFQEATRGTIYADVIRSPAIASNTTNANATIASNATAANTTSANITTNTNNTNITITTISSAGASDVDKNVTTASNVSGIAIASSVPETNSSPNISAGQSTVIYTVTVADNASASVRASMPQPPAVSANISIKTTGNNKGVLETAAASVDYTGRLDIEGSKIMMNTSAGQKQIMLPEAAINASGILAREAVQNVMLAEKSQKPVYSIKSTRQVKLLFFMPVSMESQTDVDAETGKIISVSKPWWSVFTGG